MGQQKNTGTNTDKMETPPPDQRTDQTNQV